MYSFSTWRGIQPGQSSNFSSFWLRQAANLSFGFSGLRRYDVRFWQQFASENWITTLPYARPVPVYKDCWCPRFKKRCQTPFPSQVFRTRYQKCPFFRRPSWRLKPVRSLRSLSSHTTMETGKMTPRQTWKMQSFQLHACNLSTGCTQACVWNGCRGHHALADCTRSAWTVVPIHCSQVQANHLDNVLEELFHGVTHGEDLDQSGPKSPQYHPSHLSQLDPTITAWSDFPIASHTKLCRITDGCSTQKALESSERPSYLQQGHPKTTSSQRKASVANRPSLSSSKPAKAFWWLN